MPKGRSALIRAVARASGCRTPFLARVGPNYFIVDLHDRVARTLYLYGTFEPTITAMLPLLVQPGDLVVDAGANFGYFTVLCARVAGPTGRVLAFEPDPRNLARLRQNLSANQLANVQVQALGLFDRAGHITFHLVTEGEDNLGGSSIINPGEGRTETQIDILPLDDFARSQNLAEIAFLKMDIEGAEYEALAGASELLAGKRIRRALVEMHNMVLGKDKARTIADRFTATGYCGYLVREAAGSTGGLADFLVPLESSGWLDMPNPHTLFTVEAVAGIAR